MTEVNESENLNYELTFLVKSEDSAFVRRLLEKSGAVLVNERPLQKIKLAYPIQKNDYAFIGLFQFGLKPEAVVGLMSVLSQEKELLRHSINRAIMKAEKGGSESVTGSRFREERRRPTFVKEPPKNFEPALTNEALEKKIEEILH